MVSGEPPSPGEQPAAEAPDVFLFQVAGTTVVVEVLEVDDDARRVRLRPAQPWQPP